MVTEQLQNGHTGVLRKHGMISCDILLSYSYYVPILSPISFTMTFSTFIHMTPSVKYTLVSL